MFGGKRKEGIFSSLDPLIRLCFSGQRRAIFFPLSTFSSELIGPLGRFKVS